MSKPTQHAVSAVIVAVALTLLAHLLPAGTSLAELALAVALAVRPGRSPALRGSQEPRTGSLEL